LAEQGYWAVIKCKLDVAFLVSPHTITNPTKMNSKVRTQTNDCNYERNAPLQISIILLLSLVAVARAGVVAVPSVEVLQGPSSKTTIVGPDGSAISSVAPGGTVVTDGQAVVPAAPVVLAAAPATLVAGPAGSISTTHTLAGPAVVAAAPVAVAPVVVAGVEGHEGEYIPDNTEQLYDDGSYKGE
jgi:hypothetical protein